MNLRGLIKRILTALQVARIEEWYQVRTLNDRVLNMVVVTYPLSLISP